MHPELQEWVMKNSTAVNEGTGEGYFSVRQINTNLKHVDVTNKVRIASIGPENNMEVKSVLLLGETGTGKTLFVNAFINMLFGVKFEDRIRLRLKDHMDAKKSSIHSQTEYTTAYTIYHQNGMTQPYNYMIIDTPGLGDTGGEDKDKVNEHCLRFYLTDEKWITHLNCVGIVWKGSDSRYDQRKKEILSKVKELLAFDIKAITDIILTFSTSKEPEAVAVIEASGIEYKDVFAFENGPLNRSVPRSDKEKRKESLMWGIMEENFDDFFTNLNGRNPVNLRITAKLLITQMKLESLKQEQDNQNVRKRELSGRIKSQSKNLRELETEATRVDWDKIKELDMSTEEIVLDDGRHCHYCNRCSKTCIPDCTSRHDTRKAVVESVSSTQEEAPPILEEVLDVVGNIGKVGTLLAPVSGIAGAISGGVGVLAGYFSWLLRSIRTSESKSKTKTLHENEGENKCMHCNHFEKDHKIRDKIFAKDANFDQKMKLMKQMKYQEVMGKKADLSEAIASSKQELTAMNSQMEQDDNTRRSYEREISRLRTGL